MHFWVKLISFHRKLTTWIDRGQIGMNRLAVRHSFCLTADNKRLNNNVINCSMVYSTSYSRCHNGIETICHWQHHSIWTVDVTRKVGQETVVTQLYGYFCYFCSNVACCWPFLSTFLPSLKHPIFAVVFHVFCNLPVSLSQIFSVVFSRPSFLPCVQPVSV